MIFRDVSGWGGSKPPSGCCDTVGVRTQNVRPSPIFFGILAATIAGGVLAIVENETAFTAGTVLLVLGGWAVSLCLHEFGHAYVAFKGGDYAVRNKGYL